MRADLKLKVKISKGSLARKAGQAIEVKTAQQCPSDQAGWLLQRSGSIIAGMSASVVEMHDEIWDDAHR